MCVPACLTVLLDSSGAGGVPARLVRSYLSLKHHILTTIAICVYYCISINPCVCCSSPSCPCRSVHQAYYESSPLLPPEGAIKGPCLLGSLSFLTDDFDWEGECSQQQPGYVGRFLEGRVVLCVCSYTLCVGT